MTLFVFSFATLTSAQTPTIAFTQPFDWNTSKITILPASNWGLFKADDTVTISTSDNSPITVYDLYGNTVYAGAPQSMTFEVGHYFVECNGDRNQFAVLPNDYAGASFLGDIAYDGYVDGLQRQQQIQPAWVRTGVAGWEHVQAERDTWNWTRMDKVIENNPGRKILVVASGNHPPSWVQPSNLTSHYAAYVTALAQRYKGKIHAIEIWNEPYIDLFWNSPEWWQMLADLFPAGRAAIKAVDPSILVLGPTWSSAGQFSGTEQLGEHGFGAHIDGLSWHDYWGFKFPPDQETPRGDSVAPDIFGRMHLHQEAAGFDGPTFITESGLYGQSALGIPLPPIASGYAGGVSTNAPEWSLGMARAMKYAVLYRAAGAELIIPWVLSLGGSSLSDGQDALYGWDYGYRGPAPKTSAFLMSCYWLNGAQLVDYRALGEEIILSAWRRPDNTSVVFAWAVEDESFSLPFGVAFGFNITDMYGDTRRPFTLDSQPILFHSTSSDAAAFLQSVMDELPSLNLAPDFAFLGNQAVLKDQRLQFTVSATDPDNDLITYSASPLPSGATVNPTTGVFSWTPTASQLGRYSLTFTATDARGLKDTTITLISVLGSSTDGLVGWWKLDESSGTVASDTAGSNPGTLHGFGFTGNSGWRAGKIGNGLSFDGANDYVDLDSSKLELSNNFTIAAWIHPRGDEFGVIFSLRSIYAGSGFRLAVRPNNDLLIQGQTTSGLHSTHFALEQIQDNAWNHVVVVYDKSVFAVYLNGVRVDPGHGASGNWGGDFVMNPDGVTRIGAETDNSGVGFFFDGLIDDTRVYDRTLSATEVLSLYQWRPGGSPPLPPSSLRVISN